MFTDPLCPHVSVEPPDCYDPSAWEPDTNGYQSTTVSDVIESVETNLWLDEAYRRQRAYGLARECARLPMVAVRSDLVDHRGLAISHRKTVVRGDFRFSSSQPSASPKPATRKRQLGARCRRS